jgi:hypothetical protein
MKNKNYLTGALFCMSSPPSCRGGGGYKIKAKEILYRNKIKP